MTREDFLNAIHRLKKTIGAGGAVVLQFEFPEGNVYDGGELKGNLFDE